MNNKGQIGIGTLVVVAIAVIVALTLLTGGITEGVGKVTDTTVLNNVTYTAPSGAGVAINIPYQALKGTIIVTNATSGTVIPTTNYTITNYVVSNGQLVTTLTATAGNSLGWHGKSINVSASEVEPFGYDTSAGGRVMADLIIVFAALALFMVVLVPIVKNLDFL